MCDAPVVGVHPEVVEEVADPVRGRDDDDLPAVGDDGDERLPALSRIRVAGVLVEEDDARDLAVPRSRRGGHRDQGGDLLVGELPLDPGRGPALVRLDHLDVEAQVLGCDSHRSQARLMSSDASVSLIETASVRVPGASRQLPERVADREPGLAELPGLQPQQHLLALEVVQLVALPLPAVREVEDELLARLRVDRLRVPQPGGRVPLRPLDLGRAGGRDVPGSAAASGSS